MNANLSIFIAAISFSFYPLLNSIALETTSPYLLALIAQFTVTIVALLVLIYNLKSLSKTQEIFKYYSKLPIEIKMIPFLSGTGILVGTLFFLSALSMMSKAGATLIMECWPIFAIIVARALLSHKNWQPLKLMDFILCLLALLGMLFITASESNITLEAFLKNPFIFFQTQSFDNAIGIILAVLSALCFAWGSVARSYFADKLPKDMRIKFFHKKNSLAEANFTYALTYIYGIPIAILCFYLFEVENTSFDYVAVLPIFLLSISLVLTSVFYAYGLLIATNANINLLWYIAPVLATIWLVFYGYSHLTPFIFIGGFLIILSNIILVLTNKKNIEKTYE